MNDAGKRSSRRSLRLLRMSIRTACLVRTRSGKGLRCSSGSPTPTTKNSSSNGRESSILTPRSRGSRQRGLKTTSSIRTEEPFLQFLHFQGLKLWKNSISPA